MILGRWVAKLECQKGSFDRMVERDKSVGYLPQGERVFIGSLVPTWTTNAKRKVTNVGAGFR